MRVRIEEKPGAPRHRGAIIEQGTAMNDDIGRTAGLVWHCLERNGNMRTAQLPRELGATRDQVQRAIGWLAREDKILIEGEKTAEIISLK